MRHVWERMKIVSSPRPRCGRGAAGREEGWLAGASGDPVRWQRRPGSPAWHGEHGHENRRGRAGGVGSAAARFLPGRPPGNLLEQFQVDHDRARRSASRASSAALSGSPLHPLMDAAIRCGRNCRPKRARSCSCAQAASTSARPPRHAGGHRGPLLANRTPTSSCRRRLQRAFPRLPAATRRDRLLRCDSDSCAPPTA